MKGRVLIIAGSDPSGGAGIQADIKTVTALGGYAATAITALTVQNTTGVTAVHGVAPEIIAAQIEAVMNDIGADAIKIGMIGSIEAGMAILDGLKKSGWDYGGGFPKDSAPLVFDPVLAATSGHSLAESGLVEFIKERVFPHSYVVTPNIIEAECITGVSIRDTRKQLQAGEECLRLGTEAALLKGGHLEKPEITDVLVTHAGHHEFSHRKLETTSTHGTGCTLASAIATGLAQGMALKEATARAIDYVHEAIRTAPGYGSGCGPLNHGHPLEASKNS
ncbi:bifunctional hydroxymethylpyrimidine kinase/phosphomethylpyrimidine kinase [Hyphococcus flavus]|uniref:hydroxymethylpyrimidine kinase n=1 Tax=Hyphococcus flavus TaxID=1866326 RepID=A0AAE9ZCT3_9PROT|nr:bifunctional hydroxymethylpyrimidine kinase/phosphomethylpyrimidine kinase [Hyphococcus flavus]WDI32374.1 bifunctional hydroxymethylpyrimidine kinase/phosphomethylpyrimidine kinase [Hyphococcus flavus]